MKAYHLFWSRPRHGHARLLEDFEIALMAISALAFARAQGEKPYLIIDKNLKEFLTPFQIFDLWEEIDIDLLARFEMEHSQVSTTFTNAGKVFALGKLSLPFIMLDIDAILYEPIPKEFLTQELGYAHLEVDPDFEFYPDAKLLKLEDAEEINLSPVFNMSFVWMNHRNFQKALQDAFFTFCRINQDSSIPALNLMTFGEQKLSGHLSSELKLKHGPLLGYYWSCRDKKFVESIPCSRHVSNFHHLWHQKKFLRKSRGVRQMYFENLLELLDENLPGFREEALTKIGILKILMENQ